MKRVVHLLIFVFLVAGIAVVNSCKKDAVPPTVTTNDAITNITINSATSGGIVTKDGGAAITARGVCWSTSSSPTTSDAHTSDNSGTGSFVSNLTDLTPNTLYHVRAYATNKAGTAYGNEVTFTSIPIVVPTLETTVATSITITSAVTGGNITADGNAPVTERGICWAITTGPTITNDKTSDGTGTGIFVSNLTGLQSGVIYYIRAYATNSAGTAYGNELTFTTTTPLGAPTIGTATKGNAQATVTFTAPANDGGSSITGYTVTSSPGGITATGTASPITVTGLTNGTAYTFTVIATNANGNSLPSSSSNSVTPSTVPGAPTIGTATKGIAQATVTFTAPANNGGLAITGYTVTSSPGGFTATGTSSPLTVTGLSNGTAYTFTVIATNANGNSPASSASNSVTPSAGPGTPTIGTATKGNAQATVTFTAPTSDGGSPITGYTVTSNPGGFTGAGTSSPITVTGLTNGTAYTFTVFATNASGNSAPSSASNSVIPSTVPGAPTIGTATKGNTQATVTFTAPASNGGSVITGYTVTSNPGGFTAAGTTSPLTVTGLTNGTAYTFTVTATNANGNSLPSSASNSVTPSTVPGAPTIGTATKGNAQASVAFTPPASNGGSVITGYTVTSSPGSFTGSGSSSPIVVTGLTNGTAYTFTVIASNVNGNSLPSSVSNPVRPHTATTIYDVEGTLYNLITINGQVWMKENLKTATYNTGVAIPTTTTVDLRGEATPKYQWVYNNDNANLNLYGRLYTFYAVTDPAGVCPTGFHVPTDLELWTLQHFLIDNGFAFTPGLQDIGKSMASTSGWTTDPTAGNVGNNQSTNNSSGFSAVPAGYRKSNGDPVVWHELGTSIYFRSSTEDTPPASWYYSLLFNSSILGRASYASFNGYSVRCVK